MDTIRTGIGYDSHRFAPGGPMRLAGVDIPSDVHCVGHSDADAVCHAVTDAILGATALGDIGEMFPDTAAINENRDSIEMLGLASSRLRASGWRVENIDVTVITQLPKIGPHREAMRERLAVALSLTSDSVSIKGKTNEHMGFIGRGEGLAVIAVATGVRR